MTQMTPQEIAQRDAFVAQCKIENHAMARALLPEMTSELKAQIEPDAAVLLYLYLQETYEMVNEVAPPFHELAPLVKLEPLEFEAAKIRSAEKKISEQKEFRREIDMALAKQRVEEAIAQFGEDSDQARMAMAKAIEFLPDDVRAKLNASARELGLMPPASGYLENGDPVFTVEDMASHFGMEPEQVMQDAAEFAMTVDANSVHRPQ